VENIQKIKKKKNMFLSKTGSYIFYFTTLYQLLDDEEHRDSYKSPSIVRPVKLRKQGGGKECTQKFGGETSWKMEGWNLGKQVLRMV
jgi:hypothetical protein